MLKGEDFMNNNDLQRNLSLQGIDSELSKIRETQQDRLFLELYGKERYLEYVEERNFKRKLYRYGFIAFLIGFFGVGLYMCNWNMNVLFTTLAEKFMSLF